MSLQSPNAARLLWGMFVMLVAMSGVLMFFLFYIFSGSLSDNPNVDVLKNAKLEVPNEITVGKQFEYRFTGEKLVEASGITRRQIECRINGTVTVESIDEIEPQVMKGKFEIKRLFTIPTYEQNLRTTEECRLLFVAQYNFYYSSGITDNTRAIPVTETVYSNYFRLIVDPTKQDDLSNLPPEFRTMIPPDARSPSMAKDPSSPQESAAPSGGSSSSPTPPQQSSPPESEPNLLESIIDTSQNILKGTVERINPFD